MKHIKPFNESVSIDNFPGVIPFSSYQSILSEAFDDNFEISLTRCVVSSLGHETSLSYILGKNGFKPYKSISINSIGMTIKYDEIFVKFWAKLSDIDIENMDKMSEKIVRKIEAEPYGQTVTPQWNKSNIIYSYKLNIKY